MLLASRDVVHAPIRCGECLYVAMPVESDDQLFRFDLSCWDVLRYAIPCHAMLCCYNARPSSWHFGTLALYPRAKDLKWIAMPSKSHLAIHAMPDQNSNGLQVIVT